MLPKELLDDLESGDRTMEFLEPKENIPSYRHRPDLISDHTVPYNQFQSLQHSEWFRRGLGTGDQMTLNQWRVAQLYTSTVQNESRWSTRW